MNTKVFDEAMGEIDASYVEKAMDYQPKAKKRGWTKWMASAACLALVIIAAVTIMDRQRSRIELSDESVNVTVRYTDTNKVFSVHASSLLAAHTEEELFTVHNTAIFKGTVLEVRNIELDFNGSKDYRAIARIEVEKVYRGPCSAGNVVSVLLPCPIGTDIWVEDTETVSHMRAGTTGIFMPMIYDENSVREQNGAKLILADVAGFGFADGVRYAFLEVETGLLFARYDYQSISGARTLDEVEEYIEAMLERLPTPDDMK